MRAQCWHAVLLYKSLIHLSTLNSDRRGSSSIEAIASNVVTVGLDYILLSQLSACIPCLQLYWLLLISYIIMIHIASVIVILYRMTLYSI